MKNYLTDVPGFLVGHAGDEEALTGVTVILCPEKTVGGVDVRGSAPGTRETDLLEPGKTVSEVHALALSGGSAYGLAASTGVMSYLEEQDIGLDTGFAKVPIVPQAVLYDLSIGDPSIRPNADMGYAACLNASAQEQRVGNVGAGLGATVGKAMGFDHAMKSGLGSASRCVGDLIVAALVAVNAVGDIYQGQEQLAGPYDRQTGTLYSTPDLLSQDGGQASQTNTTIGLIATNAKFDKAQSRKIAQVGHNAYARCIYPVHTSSDGDTIFSLNSGQVEADLDQVLVLAVQAMEEAIIRAIKESESLGGYPAHADIGKKL